MQKLSGRRQEAIISEIEYGCLWKSFSSSLPRLPMNPRSHFLTGQFEACLGPLELERRGWSLWRTLNFPASFFCPWTPNQRFAERQTSLTKLMERSFEYLSWWRRATFCGNMSGISRELINRSYVFSLLAWLRLTSWVPIYCHRLMYTF